MPIIYSTPRLHVVAAVREHIDRGDISAPCGVIDVEAFDYNAGQMVDSAGGLPIRVASKSLRSVAALRRALSFGGFRGILAYSVPEALKLVGEGFDDIVVAYPCVDTNALGELAAHKRAREAITVMVDCVDHLDMIEAAGPGPVRVAIELDCSLQLGGGKLVVGPRRSPLREPTAVEAFAKEILRRRKLKLVGIMAYEGQVASVPDGESGPLGTVKRWLRNMSLSDLASRRAACIDAVRSLTDLEFINGGGTGSLTESSAEGTLTELAAGSGFYAPAIFDQFTHVNHKASAFFACQVSRRPQPGWATVNSGGWIASGAIGADRAPVPVWPGGLTFSGMEGAGEVQTPLHGAAADALQPGDLVFFRHAKAGEMTEHVPSLLAVNGDGSEMWDTYRGKGWTLR